MTPEQTERFRVRVEEQAAGERASGTAYTSGSFQIVVGPQAMPPCTSITRRSIDLF